MERPDGAGSTELASHKPKLSQIALVGMAWLTVQTIVARVIGFVSQLFLAKILVPADFGVVALAGTITAIAGVLISFGADDVLLQRQKALRFWASPAFWVTMGLGLISMAAVAVSAPFAAAMYKTPALTPILLITAIGLPLGSLSTIPAVLMRADLKFRFLALYAAGETIVTQTGMVVLALFGFGVYSFVIPGVVMSIIKALVFWTLARPTIAAPKMKHVRILGTRGAAVFGHRLLGTAVSQADYVALGLFATASTLGAYFFAFRLAIQPIRMLAANLSNVLFPTLLQLRGDPVRQTNAAVTASRVLAFLVMPYCFLQAAGSRPLLEMLFGAKWSAAIPIMQILSVGLAFDAVSWNAGALLSARGHFNRAFLYAVIFTPIFFVMVTAGAYFYSGTGAAIAVAGYYMIFSPLYSYIIFAAGGVSVRQVISIYALPVLMAALSMGTASLLARFTPGGYVAQLAVIGLFGAGAYYALMRVFAPQSLDELARRLGPVVRGKLGKLAR